MRRLLAPTLTTLLLAGCMLGPDYQRPTLDVPQSLGALPADAKQTADTEWWKQFGDPVLDRLIAEALANNKDLRIAAANVEQAAGVLEQTRSSLFPQIDYTANGGRYRYSTATASGAPLANPASGYNVLAGASWELDLWGRIRRLSESAQATLLATDAARRGVVLTLVAQVATSYVQLRALDEQLVVALRTRDTYAESLKLINDKFKFGQVSKMNVAQAQSQLETAQAQIPQLRNQIKQTENALAILLGRNPGAIPRGKSVLELKLPAVPAGLPSQLLERRPDLLQAEQQLISANAQIGAAKALYFPTISLTGQFGTASSTLGDLFGGPAKSWQYVGNLAGPIFTAGAVSGQVAQAEAGQRAALASYERAVQNAFADADLALATRMDVAERLEAQKRLVAALNEYATLARLLWNGGFAPYSTVLQAEQDLFPQELNLAGTQGQMFASLVAIYRALGGGWVDLATKSAPAPQPGGGWFAPEVPGASVQQGTAAKP
jgi:multidrug efflux system outer membrane protein